MGVFAVVGLIICLIALAKQNAWMGVIGLLAFGAGVAGNINGY
jgi:hypothetical protein